ncbi:MAG: hypothetical protein Q8R37_02135 [Nanoarchaeota archaeon]|nr:hypothetical protein [Nanoarchaeota archaeon]
MGYPYDGLIPAAILYNNPGLTRDEFARAMRPAAIFSSKYWGSLEAVARVLHLRAHNGRNDDLRSYYIEENRDFGYFRTMTDWDWEDETLTVIQRNHRTFTEEEFTFVDFSPLQEKKFLYSDWAYRYCTDDDEEERFHVVEKDRFLALFETDDDDGGNNPVDYNSVIIKSVMEQIGPEYEDTTISRYQQQKIRVIPFQVYVEKIKTYDSLDDFFEEYPHLHPVQRFDWAQEKGRLETGFDCPALRWHRKDDTYFLDQEHAKKVLKDNYFNKEQMRRYPGGSWIDLILTAEAVKTGFWKVLERSGLQHLVEFFIAHPEVVQVYNQARFDMDISSFAQKKNLTNSEFLRWRLENNTIHETNPESLRKTISMEIEELQKIAAHYHKISLDVEFKTDFSAEEIERFIEIAIKKD